MHELSLCTVEFCASSREALIRDRQGREHRLDWSRWEAEWAPRLRAYRGGTMRNLGLPILAHEAGGRTWTTVPVPISLLSMFPEEFVS